MQWRDWSQTWTFFDGEWHEGNVPLWGARTHAIWLGSSVFDGARVFEGVAPDLDLHCARVNASAKTMFLKPSVSVEEWIGLTREGMKKLRHGHRRSMSGRCTGPSAPGRWRCRPIRNRRACALTLYDAPMRKPDGFSITLSPFRRPTIETAPVDAKAGCLYPNNARAMFEAKSRGFDNCLVLRHARQRRRARQLQRVHGQGRRRVHADRRTAPSSTASRASASSSCCARPASPVVETVLRYADFETADEIFATGNASKVLPVTRIGERALQPGPLYRKARELYWAFAHSSG